MGHVIKRDVAKINGSVKITSNLLILYEIQEFVRETPVSVLGSHLHYIVVSRKKDASWFFRGCFDCGCPNFLTCIIYPKELRKKMAAGHGWDYGRLRKDRQYFKLQAIANSPQFLQTCTAFSCEQPAGLPLKLWIYTGSSSAKPDS